MQIKDMFKYYYFMISKRIFGIVRILPIKRNRIICMSHRGGSQYSDSPMYITEYLLKHYPDKFEIVWEVNDLEKFSHLNEKGIRTVKYGTFKDYLLLNTSRVCITNSGFPGFLVERKNQIRLNTWHAGVAYKSEEITGRKKEKIASDYAKKMKAKIKNQYNLMLSSCKLATDTYIRGSFMYHGELMECGLPRNDIMFRSDAAIKEKVRKWFEVDSSVNILLVAPTWKDNNDTRNIDFDYVEVCRILENKTGEKWIVFLRLHHLSKVDIGSIVAQSSGKVIDATKYPDVQELLYAASFLITDYSSLIWDFALTEKPIVLFTPDADDYAEKRGFYMPIEEWGLSFAKDKNELLRVIRMSSLEELKDNSKEHLKNFGSYEDGHATERVVNRILSFCE